MDGSEGYVDPDSGTIGGICSVAFIVKTDDLCRSVPLYGRNDAGQPLVDDGTPAVMKVHK